MRIVLDTNVLLVSISRRSFYHPIFQAFENKEFDLLVSTDILIEYEEIIQENMGVIAATSVLNGFQNVSNVVYTSKCYAWGLIHADQDDNKFVDCAIAGNAEFIVTNDRHFNVLKKIPFPTVKVLSADEFLEMIIAGKL